MNDINIIENDKNKKTPQNVVIPSRSVKKRERVLLHTEEEPSQDIEDGVM